MLRQFDTLPHMEFCRLLIGRKNGNLQLLYTFNGRVCMPAKMFHSDVIVCSDIRPGSIRGTDVNDHVPGNISTSISIPIANAADVLCRFRSRPSS